MCFPLRLLDSKWQGYDLIYYHRNIIDLRLFLVARVPPLMFLLPPQLCIKCPLPRIRGCLEDVLEGQEESLKQNPPKLTQSVSPLKTNCYKVPSPAVSQLVKCLVNNHAALSSKPSTHI